jgi:2-oxo-4-hydroxy-4-carboxy-5-ureidoimidazoline decarboxylase
MTLDQLNTLEINAAKEAFLKCCGSTKWADQMISARPFSDRQKLGNTSDRIWNSLTPDDWLEAFSHHPRIGKIEDLEAKFNPAWAIEEQKGTRSAPPQVIQDLAKENLAYERRFGHIFLICATGKTAEEMLSLLQARMKHTPEVELKTAAREQSKITHLRLEKLLIL